MADVIFALPGQDEEWDGLDVGETMTVPVLLRKGDDGMAVIVEANGVAMPVAEVENEEMVMDEEDDLMDMLDKEMDPEAP